MNCRVCGRPLKAESSLFRGVGPSCAKHLPGVNLNFIGSERVQYWMKEAYETLPSAYVLGKAKQHLESAFFCHLSVEKALKGLYQLKRGDSPPFTHSLINIAAESDLKLSEEQVNLLSTLTHFQQNGRYPTNREKLLRVYPPEFFTGLMDRVADFLNWTTQKEQLAG